MNNNCKNLKQKLDRKLYCKKFKKDIKISECNRCKYKEYKSIVQKSNKNWNIKLNKPSKRTKALAISKKVKLIVWERDGHKCIFCDTPVPWNMANSHFIKRSHGGLGIEQNIITNCVTCHKEFENGKTRKDKLIKAETYLKSKYDNWNKKDLVYKK